MDPKLLGTPYVKPWKSLPSTPTLTGLIQEEFVTADDDVKIWFGLSGRPLSNSEIPVVFLHGGMADSNYFAHQIHSLQAAYSIISIDSRGQGKSFDGPGPITYDRMTRDTIEVLDHLKIPKASIIGWSDGGIIGLSLAKNYSRPSDKL